MLGRRPHVGREPRLDRLDRRQRRPRGSRPCHPCRGRASRLAMPATSARAWGNSVSLASPDRSVAATTIRPGRRERREERAGGRGGHPEDLLLRDHPSKQRGELVVAEVGARQVEEGVAVVEVGVAQDEDPGPIARPDFLPERFDLTSDRLAGRRSVADSRRVREARESPDLTRREPERAGQPGLPVSGRVLEEGLMGRVSGQADHDQGAV